MQNKWEQFGQIKGTFQVENEKSEIIYLWGSKCKKILPKFNDKTKIIKIIGYTSRSQGIHIGLVKGNNLCYRYGYGKLFYANLNPLKQLSLNNDQFEQLLTLNKQINFTAIFGEDKFQINIQPKNESEYLNQMEINGNKGNCFIILDENNDWQEDDVIENIKESTNNSLVLSLNDEHAKFNEISGGKGASLAMLIKLSLELKNQSNHFIVPQGIVVTTNAYDLQFKNNEKLIQKMNEFQQNSWSFNKEDLKSKCTNIVHFIENEALSNEIKSEIQNKLLNLFGQNYEDVLFAVRSSGVNEDSEEMSSAGQMITYLGVKGFSYFSI